jgi:hypothetical protein
MSMFAKQAAYIAAHTADMHSRNIAQQKKCTAKIMCSTHKHSRKAQQKLYKAQNRPPPLLQ